jgi:hypothetical protein
MQSFEQNKKAMKRTDLWYKREALLSMDSKVWENVLPFRALSGQVTSSPEDNRNDPYFQEWDKRVNRKIASADIKLTKRYFPEYYDNKLSGYVRHKKTK